MKTKLQAISIAFILSFMCVLQINAQVTYTGDVNLSSQAEVDAFRATNAYTYIDGSLNLATTNSDITNLQALSGIDSISGNLKIYYQTNLVSLQGLETFKKIGGRLWMYKLNIDALDALSNVEEAASLYIVDCDNLITLDGLNSQLTITTQILLGNASSLSYGNASLKDYCAISDEITRHLQAGTCVIGNNFYNPDLQDFQDGNCEPVFYDWIYYGNIEFTNQTMIDTFYTAEHPYTYVLGDVKISGSSIINYNGIAHLDSCSGKFSLYYQNSITDASGLNNLKKANNIVIYGSSSFTDLSMLSSLEECGNLQVSECSSINNIGPNEISTDVLTVSGCDNIDTLDLSNITLSESATLRIADNNNLKAVINSEAVELKSLTLDGCSLLIDLSGFVSLQTISSSFHIFSCSSLTSFDDFVSLDSIGNFFRAGVYNTSQLGNDNLRDYCQISDAILTCTNVFIDNNLYNPTTVQLQNGECAPPALDGDVSINGECTYGEELTATVTGSNNTGTLSYQWKHNGVNISGARAQTYTLTETDIAVSISVEITSSVETGSISSTETAAIAKADQATPAAPTVDSKTDSSITLNVVAGCEYAIDGGTWQTEILFESLEANTQYSLTQRLAETSTHNASPASTALDVTIDMSTSLTNNTIADKLQVYPNPASDELTIRNLTADNVVVLFDALGNKVLQENVTAPEIMLNISHLQKGIYFVKVDNQTMKIIVE